MAITAEQKYLLNRMNSVAAKVQLGTLLDSADSVVVGDIALADGTFPVGNASGVAAAVAMSGDATMTRLGVVTIAAAAVTLAKLAAGITPSHVIKYAARYTTLGGSATEAITVAGVAATDIVTVSLSQKGVTPRTILTAIPSTNTITLVFSGDPSTDHKVDYVVHRAAS